MKTAEDLLPFTAKKYFDELKNLERRKFLESIKFLLENIKDK